jgi:hypothetical protein
LVRLEMVVLVEVVARALAPDGGVVVRLEILVAMLPLMGLVELAARALAPDGGVLLRLEMLVAALKVSLTGWVAACFLLRLEMVVLIEDVARALAPDGGVVFRLEMLDEVVLWSPWMLVPRVLVMGIVGRLGIVVGVGPPVCVNGWASNARYHGVAMQAKAAGCESAEVVWRAVTVPRWLRKPARLIRCVGSRRGHLM